MRFLSFCIVLLIAIAMPSLRAQKFTTEKSYVAFFSDAAIEDIKAENKKTSSIFNSSNGEIVFSIPIKDFQFAKSLMKQHFNEKYMETEKFPKATFQGSLSGFDLTAEGEQKVTALGQLTIHGVAQEVTVPGILEVQGKKIIMKSVFIVKLVDYQIMIPQLLFQNIAEAVEITMEFTYKPG